MQLDLVVLIFIFIFNWERLDTYIEVLKNKVMMDAVMED